MKTLKENTVNAISEKRMVAIIRKIDNEHILRYAEALIKGGVTVMELPFDSSGLIPESETAKAIGMIRREFGEDVTVGAGTVLTKEQANTAVNAGAVLIVSPNTDEEVIAETNRMGAVSVPGAYTPTEIALAVKYGADFVKVFPANALPKSYASMIRTPLAKAKLLAVGGITLDDMAEYYAGGYYGVAVGASLCRPEFVKNEAYDELRKLAALYAEAAQKNIGK